jgi:hypothetical protein
MSDPAGAGLRGSSDGEAGGGGQVEEDYIVKSVRMLNRPQQTEDRGRRTAIGIANGEFAADKRRMS